MNFVSRETGATRRPDKSSLDSQYLSEINEAFQKACRAVIVRLDDDPSFDKLLDGPLAKDLDDYDRGRISSGDYVRRIYDVLEQKKLTSAIDRANRAFALALDAAGPVLHYLHIHKNWDKTKSVDFRAVVDLLADVRTNG